MTDWYQTKSARKVGFTGRPVVGGVFMQMLYDKSVWSKYAGRDRTKAANWAPMPKPPVIEVIIPAADKQPAQWRYTLSNPPANWTDENFDAASWQEGLSGFGTPGTPGAIPTTLWNTGDIWLRRDVDISADQIKNVQIWFHHDDDAEVYINGVLALTAPGFVSSYDCFPLSDKALAALKPGKNTVAIHCHQISGGQYIDLGLIAVHPN
jgi:hypothetical protein